LRCSWERYGIPGEQLEQEEFAKARADIVRRLSRLIGARVEAGGSSPARAVETARGA